MKIIEVDEELYQYIASHTQSIGESASDILRRLLHLSSSSLASSAFNALVERAEKVEQIEKLCITPTENHKVDDSQNQIVEIPPSAVQKSMDFSIGEEQSTSNHELVRQLLNSEEFKQENKGVSRFLSILTALYQTDKSRFSSAICSENVQGRTRQYFANDEKTLLAVGNHTKPKAIPQTPYWVITNNNSGRKMIMLEAVMREMCLPHNLIEQVKHSFVGN